jgi:hypothetical protein
MIPRWPALDHVRRQRERATGDADDRRATVQPGANEANRFENEPQVCRRVDRPEAGEIVPGPDRPVDDRPAGGELHRQTHRLDRQHDVGEQDRPVGGEAVSGLQRHLRCE